MNTYYIKGTYPKDVATLTKAECTETASADKAVNIAEDGSFLLMNHVSDGTKKDIYTLTFKAQKNGSFALNFAETAGALLYDTENGSADRLLNITTENATVTVSGSTESGGNTTGYEDNTIRADCESKPTGNHLYSGSVYHAGNARYQRSCLGTACGGCAFPGACCAAVYFHNTKNESQNYFGNKLILTIEVKDRFLA